MLIVAKSGHHRSLCLKLFPSPDQNSNTAPQNTTTTTEPQNISNVVKVEEIILSSGSQVNSNADSYICGDKLIG